MSRVFILKYSGKFRCDCLVILQRWFRMKKLTTPLVCSGLLIPWFRKTVILQKTCRRWRPVLKNRFVLSRVFRLLTMIKPLNTGRLIRFMIMRRLAAVLMKRMVGTVIPPRRARRVTVKRRRLKTRRTSPLIRRSIMVWRLTLIVFTRLTAFSFWRHCRR